MERVYVTHTCRNSRLKPTDPNYCDRAFIDIDKYNAQDTPPTWKYCPECVKKGFSNSKNNSKKEKNHV